MKKLLLLIVILFSVSYSFAQEEQLSEKEKARREKNIQAGNPFARFGYKAKVATLSKGKYLEFHDLDSIVKIGSFSYHVKRKVVTGFTKYDTVYPESTLRPEIVSRWLSPDPLSEEFPSWSPYNFTLNNPIRFIDPDGLAAEDVIIVFNRETNKLAIIDLDHYKAGLPTVSVSASDYKLGGIRDKDGNLTQNQILIMDNVFTGGKANNGEISRDPNRPQQKAIPTGDFDIVDNDADTKHSGWFRLDTKDSKPYNDKDDKTGRNGFRFHLGTESWGCVTCDVSTDDRKKEWDVVTSIFQNTSTTTVKEKRGKQSYNPFSRLTNYGTMKIVGEDKIKPKK